MKCVYDESKECQYLDCSMVCFMKEEIYTKRSCFNG